MKKYRLVKVSHASGIVTWRIEKRCLGIWQYVDGYVTENSARHALAALKIGVPLQTREVIE